MSKKLTLGIQSPEGQKRVSILGSSKLEELYKEVQKAFGLPSATFLLTQDQRKELKIENSKLRTVTQAKLKHGDRLFMHNSAALFQSNGNSSSTTTSPSVPSVIVVEDPLDVELGKQTGQIAKSKDRVNCQHQGNSQCVHCIPYDPFDPEYLKEQGIKFMSFHSYLRMKSGGLSKVRKKCYKICPEFKPSQWMQGKFAPLRNMVCRVVHSSRCEHAPYPQVPKTPFITRFWTFCSRASAASASQVL